MGNLRREINWQRSNCDLKRKNIRVSLLTSAFIVTMDRGHVDTRHGASLFKARYHFRRRAVGRLAVLYISVFDFDRICVTRVSDDCVNCVCLVAYV